MNRVLPLLVIIPFFLAACGNTVERATERAIERESGGEADVDIDGDTMRVETEEGKLTVGEQELPVDWPTDVPIFPESKVQMSGSTAGEGRGASLTTAEPKSAVTAYYKKELPAAGWTVDTTGDMGPMTIVGASKNGRKLALQISESGGQTSIMVYLAEEE